MHSSKENINMIMDFQFIINMYPQIRKVILDK